MTRRRPRALAISASRETDRSVLKWVGLAGLVAGSILATVSLARAEGHEEVTVTHAFSNFGSLKYGPDFPHLNYVNPDAPKGGEISTWAQGNFDSFNNYTRKGVPGSGMALLFENVLVSTADDAYGTYCYLCTTMEFPESKDWVIFNLREDVTFADGTPATAEDAKFTFDLFMEQGLPEYVNVVKGFVSSVELLDTYRIKYNFAEKAPRREVIGFAGGIPVFSKAWFEESGARIDESTLEPFLGTGPYVLESFDVGRQIIYARNPNFWGADNPFNVGQNNFDRVRYEYFADSSAALEAFKAGEYTFRIENSSKDWATGYDFPGVANGSIVKAELPNGNIGTAQSFIFNLRRPEWQDPRTREAVRLMFNFEFSNESLFFGLYERVNSFWENSELEATGTPSAEEIAILQPLVNEGLLDASILSQEAVMAPTSGPRNFDRRNLRRAAGLLDEAGWITGDDGIRRKDGQVLDLVLLSFSPAFDRIINPYIENLKRLGIDAVLERVDISQYIDRRRTSDYDLVNHTFSMGFEPGFGLRQWYGSETAEDSSRNLMGLQNEAVDRLLEVVIAAKTQEELTTATHALDRTLRAEAFWVQQWFKPEYWTAYYNMFKHPEDIPPFGLGQFSWWWHDADAEALLREQGAL
ncbi:extracellular solute-binding protein [uncultured Boseongicola sp.]|jgi:microcin C transport system substrate-binding protein|uniref:extracellular solute-binding protein n=1 Tax=uncultured Boseongicola sp. TaxID=1648499 RepID=UPI00261B442A|nr:extracellular solute-binding protein [uncultured Boseongicola sp.]